MLNTDSESKRQQLIQTYDGLSPLEQQIVQLFAVVYQKVNRTLFITILSKSGLRAPNGKVFVPKSFNPILHRLAEQEVVENIDSRYRCHPLLVEIVTQQAVQAGHFKSMAQAVQEADPVPNRRYSFYKPFNNYEQALREIRIHLYLGAYNKMYDVVDTCIETYPEQFERFNPFVMIFNNPFDKAFLRKQPLGLINTILLYTLQYSLMTLQPAPQAFELLEELGSQADAPALLKHLLCEQLILTGRYEQAGLLIDDRPNIAIVLATRAWLHFIEGRDADALADYEAAHKMLRKTSGKRKIYFNELAGVFYVMGLLHEGSAKSLTKALEITNIVESARDNPYYQTYRALKTAVLLQQGVIAQPGSFFSGKYSLAELKHIDGILFLIINYWLDTINRNHFKTISSKLLSEVQQSGYHWLADELQALLAKLYRRAYPEQASPQRRFLVDLIQPQAPWERALDALTNISSNATNDGTAKPAQVNQSRLVWLLSYYDSGVCYLEPREQKLDKNGNWTKGRPVALKRLYKNSGALDFLTTQDIKACTHIHPEYQNYYGNVSYEMNSDRALPALVGHPLLFWANAPRVNVELVKGEPELIVEQKGSQLKLEFNPPIAEQRSVYITKETPTRLKLIEISDAHKRVATIIGNSLSVPQSAQERVFKAVGAVANIVTVQSNIGEILDNLETVDGDPQPHLHLLPFAEGLKCELLVRPFRDKGPYYRPGSGGETVIAEVDSKRQQARRDLTQERQVAEQIIAQIPTLQRLEAMNGEWTLEQPEDCLETLLELQALGDAVNVEWPEGEKYRLSGHGQITSDQFRLNIRRQNDWFNVSGELKVDENLVLDLRNLLDLLENSDGRFIKLEEGHYLALTQEFRRRLEEFSSFAELTAKGARFNPLAAAAIDDFTQEIGALKSDKHWKEYVARLREAEALQPELPSTFQGELRDYQLRGFQWLVRLAHWGVGACLADDMGLGKTIQALALLLTRAQDGPSLVVAPTSVCMNWQSEALRFAPTLNVVMFGSGDRQKTLDNLGPFDLLICSYGLLQNEIDKLAEQSWQVIILDEAQAIKNFATKRSQAAMNLQGEFKMITTGTPIENHLGELWNLFRFINPGLLGSQESFNQRFALPIERDKDAQARHKLRKLIQMFILRRVKSEVLAELPPRTEILLHVEQNPEERALYEALRRQALEKLHFSDASGPKHLQILAQIMKLRRACCNPQLVVQDSAITSAKLATFAELVDELLSNRHKALVFSQFVDHLSILRKLLDEKNISYQYLDGSTPQLERKKRVDAFQAGQGDIFLISLKAGGVGLNLTAADYVIHMDPWWNPAVEDQAADRAHRIGQQRPVTIYRLVTKNTIEEKIVELHQHKRDLATSLLEGNDVSGKLSADDLLALLQEG